MQQVIDQLGREVRIDNFPKRIVSLVPSQTELLYDLGLREEVVGITKFCIHPDEWFRTKTRIGGTKKIDIEKIRSLKPDLIIGNKEENERTQVEELMNEFSVWMSDIKTVEDALKMIEQVGNMVAKKAEALNLVKKIESEFSQLNTHISPIAPLSVAYIIWNNPLMTAGGDTFINDMLSRSGFKNVFAEKERYPEISKEELSAANPELIFLSSEPFPFKEKHTAEFNFLCQRATVLLVDGEMFSWYGSRLIKACDYIRNLIKTL